MLEAFHFLRPLWLSALAPTLGLYLLFRRSSSERQWRAVVAPHLLSPLLVSERSGMAFRPLHLVASLLVIGSIALSGPTWERERSPFTQDTAPLVIALDLSLSMNAIDVQPSRLERAKQKVRDLLALRQGSRTALVAYAGSSHTVLPLSDDASLLETFLSALESDLMPVSGKEPGDALVLAAELLRREDVPGSILFLTDGISAEQVPDFVAHARESDDAVLVLAVGTREGGPVRVGDNQFATDATGRRLVATLDREGLQSLSRNSGAFVASVTVSSEDVEQVQRRIQRHLEQAQEEDETSRWKDFGYYLVIPVALLGALWFRRGWTLRWSLTLGLFTLSGCSTDLWLTPDQQGRRLFERGNFEESAEQFEDPTWKGVACYRAGDYQSAVDAFSRVATEESDFNLGNAYAQLEMYPEAVQSYERALTARPDWVEARENLELVQALVQKEAQDEPPEAAGPPSFGADEVVFDERGEKGESGEVDMSLLSDEQLSEMWMRRLSTSPADFLRTRFAMESARSEESEP